LNGITLAKFRDTTRSTLAFRNSFVFRSHLVLVLSREGARSPANSRAASWEIYT
jgi:hypothetical protein